MGMRILEIFCYTCFAFIGVMLIVCVGPELAKFSIWWGNIACICAGAIVLFIDLILIIKMIIREVKQKRREEHYWPGEWTRR